MGHRTLLMSSRWPQHPPALSAKFYTGVLYRAEPQHPLQGKDQKHKGSDHSTH